jgi:hypothetical protein
MAITAETGTVLWTTQGIGFNSSVTVYDDSSLLLVDTNGTLLCLYAPTSKQLWQAGANLVSSLSPIVNYDGSVFVGDKFGRVFSYLHFSGQPLWNVSIGNTAVASITLGDYGTRLYATTAGSGKVVFVQTCAQFPMPTATLFSRSNMTYFVTVPKVYPTGAKVLQESLVANGQLLDLVPNVVDEARNSFLYTSVSEEDVGLEYLVTLDPAPGVRSLPLIIRPPGLNFFVYCSLVVLSSEMTKVCMR